MSAQFVWFDLTAANPDRQREFYGELFGWTIGKAAVAGRYQAWLTDGDQPWAGITQADPATSGRWLPYVVVDDLEASTKRAVERGASVVVEATDGPAGTAVTIADPEGAQVALFKPHENMG